jgi:hypothetical protein
VIDSLDSLILLFAFTPRQFVMVSDTMRLRTPAGDPALAVSGNSPPPIALVSTPAISFPPIALGDSVSTSLAIFNRGVVNPLSVTRLSVSSRAFRINRRPPFTIVPRDSSVLTLQFVPRAGRPQGFGTVEDTLWIGTNGGSFRIPLGGESPPPRIETPTSFVDLGEIALGDSARRTVRLTNLSVNPLQIDSLRVRTSSFRVTTHQWKVRRGDTVSVPVHFVPWRYGASLDTLLVFSNIPDSPTRIHLRGSVPPPSVHVGRNLLEFGEVPAGESVRLVLAISNSSITPLAIDSITTRKSDFRVERFPVYTGLRKGDTLRVTITFSPDSVAFYCDTLVIANNSLTRAFRVPLVGIGREPQRQDTDLPGSFALHQNYPNPFKGVTTFRYALPERCAVRLVVYNSLGQEIGVAVDAEQDAGVHNIPWRVETASGMYLFKLTAIPTLAPDRQHVASKRMMILR